MKKQPLWRCDGCGYERRCYPLAGDDWGGVCEAVGPECPTCEMEMEMEMEAVDESELKLNVPD